MIKKVPVMPGSRRSWLVLVVLLALFPFLTSSCNWFQGGGDSEPQTVGPDGGTFSFENGITMVVPSGAMREDASVQMNMIDTETVASILQQGDNPLRPLVFFEALPDGMQLGEPIEVVLPLSEDDVVEGWPVHLEIDMENETFTYASTGLRYDPGNQEVTFILDHFSPHGAGVVPDGEVPNECEDPATACRCGTIYVETEFHDYASDDCQGVSGEIKVQFLDCPGQPTDPPDRFSEMTEGCTWVGSLGYHFVMFMEGQEITMNCSDPIPFVVNEQGVISGAGTMQCVIDDTLVFTDPEVGSITTDWDVKIDVSQTLSGNLDGFALKFDAPKTESVTGYLKITATVPEFGPMVLADIQLGEATVSGEVGVVGDFTLLTFSGPTDAGEDSSSIPGMSFPLLNGETFELTHQEEGVVTTLTVTLNLSVGSE